MREKNGLLGIVLEVVEGGGWKGSYEELEEVVGRLEKEGEKEWRERKGKKREGGGRGNKGGMEWREMGRLAREVGWAIEKRKREGEGEEGEIITLEGMKKNLADEKKKAEEEKRKREEERMRAEKEKRELEERIRNLEREVKEPESRLITSLDGTSVIFPQSDGIKREGNTIIHLGSSHLYRNCFIGGEMTSVWNLFSSSPLPFLSLYIYIYLSIYLYLYLSIIGNTSDVCIIYISLSHSLSSLIPSLSAHSSFVI